MMFKVAIVAAVAAATLAAADTAPVQAWQVAGVEMSMKTPAGFCAPTGTGAGVAQMVAATDEASVTHLTMFQCGDADGSKPDYFMVKTPKAALTVTTERAPFLDSIAAAMKTPTIQARIGTVTNEDVAKNFDKVFGDRPDIGGAIKPLGRDDVCVYLGGVMSYKTPLISYSRAVSGCITAVGGKVITITRYSDGVPANVVKHLATVRAMALAVNAKAPKP
ncbi:hypothetical protein M9980_01570 [Sphingomonas donggukensis]|uniref:Uncharacterized protein n=1 Tax=Sphingomonas donggukensis TaxID=2949093 RepID=A0ABY4TU81_9SPHN|nr:hypothetical protein [Sphingomonas donggukensis]URW75947.1 hypothetical protein M9980_01570 [Sphingomonas donggukensis]